MEKPELVILEEALDDWELIEDMQMIADGSNPLKSVSVFKKLIGDEQYDALKEYLRYKDGRVKTTAMIEELQALMDNSDLKK